MNDLYYIDHSLMNNCTSLSNIVLLYLQKLPKVNRDLAQRLMDEDEAQKANPKKREVNIFLLTVIGCEPDPPENCHFFKNFQMTIV